MISYEVLKGQTQINNEGGASYSWLLINKS